MHTKEVEEGFGEWREEGQAPLILHPNSSCLPRLVSRKWLDSYGERDVNMLELVPKGA
jgi:hypothetical protein